MVHGRTLQQHALRERDSASQPHQSPKPVRSLNQEHSAFMIYPCATFLAVPTPNVWIEPTLRSCCGFPPQGCPCCGDWARSGRSLAVQVEAGGMTRTEELADVAVPSKLIEQPACGQITCSAVTLSPARRRKTARSARPDTCSRRRCGRRLPGPCAACHRPAARPTRPAA